MPQQWTRPGRQTQVSNAIPSLAGLEILASLALFQALQRQAFASIQLAPRLMPSPLTGGWC